MEQSDLSREEILEQWFDNLPLVVGIIDTAWGRIALLLLPRFIFADCNGFWGGLKNWEFFDILWNPNCQERSDFFKKSDLLSPLKCLPKIRYNQEILIR